MDAGKIGSINPETVYQRDQASSFREVSECKIPERSDEVSLSGSVDKAADKSRLKLAAHVPSELILRFKGDLPDNLNFKSIKMKVIKNYDLPDSMVSNSKGALCHVKIESGQTVEEALAELSKDKRIAYAEPNYVITLPKGEENEAPPEVSQANEQPSLPQNKPNDLDKKLWGLNNEGQTGGRSDADIDAPEAWNIATGNSESGPLIAVIDTGVDYDHPDLQNNIWTNPGEIPGDGIDNDGNGFIDDVHGYDFCNKDGDPMDDHGHGTHCAGTIAAEGNNEKGVVGVNWKARIMPIKFLSRSGYGTTADAVESVIYSIKMGAGISSNSWSGGDYSQALKDAIDAFPGLFIAAAGNESADNDKNPRYPSSYDSPNIISVAASDHNDELAYFSCYGKESVDLTAPGVRVYSTTPNNQYGTKSGTSMATPHVAGAAGLVASNNPELSTAEVKDRLLGTVDKIPGFEDKMVSGGRLNLYNALKEDEQPPHDEQPPPNEQHPPDGQPTPPDGSQPPSQG